MSGLQQNNQPDMRGGSEAGETGQGEKKGSFREKVRLGAVR